MTKITKRCVDGVMARFADPNSYKYQYVPMTRAVRRLYKLEKEDSFYNMVNSSQALIADFRNYLTSTRRFPKKTVESTVGKNVYLFRILF